MRVKLRASGRQAIIPTPPPALRMGGDATPVTNRMPFHNGASSGVVHFGPAFVNIGIYIPPPKNPIWAVIPTSIVPTPYTGQQPFRRGR